MGASERSRCSLAAIATTAAVVALLSGSPLGCVRQRERVAPIPPPRPGEAERREPAIENPYRQGTPGLLSRVVFRGETPEVSIEVHDLLIGPQRRATDFALPGAAVLEVRHGSGVLTAAGKETALRTGTTLVVDAGQSMTIANDGADALTIRAHVVVPKR